MYRIYDRNLFSRREGKNEYRYYQRWARKFSLDVRKSQIRKFLGLLRYHKSAKFLRCARMCIVQAANRESAILL
jgi:thiamine biosynthesis protein ThiC